MDGESPLDAVEREIEEESGKPASGLRYCGELVVANQVLCHDHTIYLFEGDMTFGLDELHLTEGQRLELFYFEEFLQLKFADFLKDFIVDHMRMTNQLP